MRASPLKFWPYLPRNSLSSEDRSLDMAKFTNLAESISAGRG